MTEATEKSKNTGPIVDNELAQHVLEALYHSAQREEHPEDFLLTYEQEKNAVRCYKSNCEAVVFYMRQWADKNNSDVTARNALMDCKQILDDTVGDILKAVESCKIAWCYKWNTAHVEEDSGDIRTDKLTVWHNIHDYDLDTLDDTLIHESESLSREATQEESEHFDDVHAMKSILKIAPGGLFIDYFSCVQWYLYKFVCYALGTPAINKEPSLKLLLNESFSELPKVSRKQIKSDENSEEEGERYEYENGKFDTAIKIIPTTRNAEPIYYLINSSKPLPTEFTDETLLFSYVATKSREAIISSGTASYPVIELKVSEFARMWRIKKTQQASEKLESMLDTIDHIRFQPKQYTDKDGEHTFRGSLLNSEFIRGTGRAESKARMAVNPFVLERYLQSNTFMLIPGTFPGIKNSNVKTLMLLFYENASRDREPFSSTLKVSSIMPRLNLPEYESLTKKNTALARIINPFYKLLDDAIAEGQITEYHTILPDKTESQERTKNYKTFIKCSIKVEFAEPLPFNKPKEKRNNHRRGK